MHLEQIIIHGFKSFANKSVLDFRPAYKQNNVGITAIVGPNGSGKSNIVDAIRWALGEQSTKNLRSKKSEDVIFAGSEKKPRNSSAEVSLRLNNDDKKIDLDFSEIELTRQLFRNGESDYLINNQKSRLQDIHYLLAQANIGQKSYTVIGQGMIDTVLNSTPQQRKEFFDEAAGIRQYQIKRDQAANKLQNATDNLKQGVIQLQEISPRLRSLHRQMKRWEQREEIISNLTTKLNNFYSYHWHDISSNLKKSLNNKLELEKNKKTLQAKLDKLQEEMHKLASESPADSSFDSLQNKYSGLLDEKNNLTRQLAQWQGRQDSKWIQTGQHSLSFSHNQLEQTNQTIRKLKEELTVTYENIKTKGILEKELEKNYRNQIAEIRKIQEKIFANYSPAGNENSKKFVTVKQELDLIVNEIERLVTEIMKKPEAATNLKDKLAEAIKKIRHNLGNLPSNTPPASVTDLHKKLGDLENKKNIVDKQLTEIRGQIKFWEEKASSLTKEISQKKETKETLEKQFESLEANQTNDQEQAEINKNITEFKNKISTLETELLNLNQKLTNFNQVEEKKKKQIFSEQQRALDIQKELNSIHQQLTNFEVELARWQTRKEDLRHQASQDFNKSWEELVEVWKTITPSNESELGDLENEIQQLKRKREIIGSIDDETKHEYEETKERHQWLEQQTNDLQQAIDTLLEVITNLDKQIEEQFNTNIKRINTKFSDYFSMLFNGGKAELKTRKADTETDEEQDDDKNELEGEGNNENYQKIINKKDTIIGVDIMATPPGKRLQNISMLSGGEKALTSIALICAIIANNTSPFVVLDEVDAALDEANSVRFSQILEELAHQTQFIVVTHNRATMEKAQLLYGVTMGDDGVSKLLSIKLEEGKKYTNR